MTYFPHLSVYCVDKYVAPGISDLLSTLDDCSLAACSICRQVSRNEESTYASSSFSSAPTIEGTPEAWVIPTTPNMLFPMEGLGDSYGGGKKTLRWFPYVEELDSSNSSSFDLMPNENSRVGKGLDVSRI